MSEIKRSTGTDWAKADAYVNTSEDYEELPEVDDEFFERATLEVNGKPARGRPLTGRQHADPEADERAYQPVHTRARINDIKR